MAHFRKRCITILLTNECNLRCKYCYCDNPDIKNSSINMKFVQRAILDHFNAEGHLFVRFFGNGEPTLKYSQIRDIIADCKKIDADAEFELQTNGSFNEEVCDWLSKNLDIIWISYDGTTKVNKLLSEK